MSDTATETYYYLAPSPVTGLRRPFEMERLPNPTTGFAGDRYWYEADGLDSIVALTDESGDLVTPYLYDEYGRMLAGTADLQIFAYTAQDYDPETGLYHFYARYYDPARGVWLTQDVREQRKDDPKVMICLMPRVGRKRRSYCPNTLAFPKTHESSLWKGCLDREFQTLLRMRTLLMSNGIR